MILSARKFQALYFLCIRCCWCVYLPYSHKSLHATHEQRRYESQLLAFENQTGTYAEYRSERKDRSAEYFPPYIFFIILVLLQRMTTMSLRNKRARSPLLAKVSLRPAAQLNRRSYPKMKWILTQLALHPPMLPPMPPWHPLIMQPVLLLNPVTTRRSRMKTASRENCLPSPGYDLWSLRNPNLLSGFLANQFCFSINYDISGQLSKYKEFIYNLNTMSLNRNLCEALQWLATSKFSIYRFKSWQLLWYFLHIWIYQLVRASLKSPVAYLFNQLDGEQRFKTAKVARTSCCRYWYAKVPRYTAFTSGCTRSRRCYSK